MKYIIGMGNILRGDDGIGSHIINHILENNLEDGFHALDFATNAWGILPLLDSKTEKILIIDCSCMNLKPGDIQFFSLDSILYKNKLMVESHESNIAQLINMASKTDYFIPPITIMGIEPGNMEFGQSLTSIIKHKLSNYAQQAIQFIDS